MNRKQHSMRSKNHAKVGWPRCSCGCQAMLRPAQEVCRRANPGAMAYVCIRYPSCDSYVMAKPDTLEPMGELAGPELRRLRRAAHVSFNRIYESGLMTKCAAYQWLANTVQAPISHAHIGHLGEYYCRVVIEESEKLLVRRAANPSANRQTEGRDLYASAH